MLRSATLLDGTAMIHASLSSFNVAEMLIPLAFCVLFAARFLFVRSYISLDTIFTSRSMPIGSATSLIQDIHIHCM